MSSLGDFFDSVSEHYDGARVPQAYIDIVIESLELAPGSRLIELGCGTGTLAIEIARRGVEVVAVDTSPAMINLAKSKPDADLVTWVNCSAEFFSFEAGEYDAIFSFEALHLIADASWIASQINRSLRPGGSFGIGWLERAWEIDFADVIAIAFEKCGIEHLDWGLWRCDEAVHRLSMDHGWRELTTRTIAREEHTPIEYVVESVLAQSYAARLPRQLHSYFGDLLSSGLYSRIGRDMHSGQTQFFLRYSSRAILGQTQGNRLEASGLTKTPADSAALVNIQY